MERYHDDILVLMLRFWTQSWQVLQRLHRAQTAGAKARTEGGGIQICLHQELKKRHPRDVGLFEQTISTASRISCLVSPLLRIILTLSMFHQVVSGYAGRIHVCATVPSTPYDVHYVCM